MKFNYFIGIDVSKKTLDFVIFNQINNKQSLHQVFDNNEKGFAKAISWLQKQKVVTSDAIFCIEHTGAYSVKLAMYFERNLFNYSMISGLELKKSLGIIRGKTDKTDAFQIARYAYLHREEIKITKFSSKTILKIKSLLKERERIVKMQVVDKQILAEQEYLQSKQTLKRTKDRLIILEEDIKEIEKEIEEVIETDEELKKNYDLCISVTGIGLVNAVLFLVYTGNFQTITNERKYASYGGIAPFAHSSGTSIKGKTKVSKIANIEIKTQLSNAARSAIQWDKELKAYYKRKMDEGKEYGVVLNAVKFKLITRVFAVIKRQTPFVKLRQAS